jgi:hypothetical protein
MMNDRRVGTAFVVKRRRRRRANGEIVFEKTPAPLHTKLFPKRRLFSRVTRSDEQEKK